MTPTDPQPARETQQTIGAWIAATFPGTDPESPRKSLRLLEEAIELCFACGATPTEIHRTTLKAIGDRPDTATYREPDKIAGETADVVIVACGVADMRGFDLAAEVDKKMAINRARTWKVNGDGTGYHVKPAAPQ